MTVVLERLTLVDANIVRKNDEKSLKPLLPKLRDRITARMLLRGMNSTIDSFIIMTGGLVELVAKNNRERMIEIIQPDTIYYDNVKTEANREDDLDRDTTEVSQEWLHFKSF